MYMKMQRKRVIMHLFVRRTALRLPWKINRFKMIYFNFWTRMVATKKEPIFGCVPRFVEKERRPPLRHQGIRSGGNLRVFENLAQTLVAVDAP